MTQQTVTIITQYNSTQQETTHSSKTLQNEKKLNPSKNISVYQKITQNKIRHKNPREHNTAKHDITKDNSI